MTYQQLQTATKNARTNYSRALTFAQKSGTLNSPKTQNELEGTRERILTLGLFTRPCCNGSIRIEGRPSGQKGCPTCNPEFKFPEADL